MPTMVMSQLPKSSGNARKRQKNKNDHIVAISYMYVGTPKKKFTFYVRERMLYRSNVEVTYEDVYNYLATISNDETVSLHYSVNGLYVPITTTGQLHTFIRHVHNDPTAFLYVENQDYVWNVTPQSKSHKMEKRVPNGGATPIDGDSEQYDSTEDEEVSHVEDENCDSEEISQDEEEYEDEEGEEYDDDDESRIAPILTDYTAPMIVSDKIPLKEAFVEPKPRGQTGQQQDTEVKHRLIRIGDPLASPAKKSPLSNRQWTESQAYHHVKNILSDTLSKKSMDSAPTLIAEQLVRDVWNPSFPYNEKVHEDTVALLAHSLGTGLLHYYNRILSRYAPCDISSDYSPRMEKLLKEELMPAHDPEFLIELVESATIVCCDMLESVQHLAQLQRQFDYFNNINEKYVKAKPNEKDPLPPLHDMYENLRTAVTSAYFGFNILEPMFPPGCECKEAIRLVTLELQKVHVALKVALMSSNSPQYVDEVKRFSIESIHSIIGKFTTKVCSQHNTIELALRSSEVSKWRSNVEVGFENWIRLRDKGLSHSQLSCQLYDTLLVRPTPYALQPKICTSVADGGGSKPSDDYADLISKPLNSGLKTGNFHNMIDATLAAFDNLSVEEKIIKETNGKAASNVAASHSTAPTTTTTSGEASGGGQATISKKMSPELQKMVDMMYKKTPPHNYVYPPPPKPGAILVPTGGLAHCRCSKNCTESLMEPAYEYVERFNEPRQTVWEKTKQKRFKKN